MKRIAKILAVMLLFSLLTLPVAAEDLIVFTTADSNYSEEGSWQTTTNSAIQGYPGVPSRYLSSEGSAKWIPQLKQGTYKVFVYKTVHESSLFAQVFEIIHRGKTDYAVVDFTTGEPGWTEIGTFDFWGDGDDSISVYREDGLDQNKVTRLSAIAFELVSLIDEPIPEEKPEIIPGTPPEIEEPEPEIPVSDVKAPEKVGDSMLIPANDPIYAKQNGEWKETFVAVGYNGISSYYASASGSSFTYTPYMPAGKYKVEIFRPVHSNSLKDQTFIIQHMEQEESVSVDFTTGASDWYTLGTYDFWGNGYDTVSVTKTDGGQVPIRNSAIRFTLLELSDTPAPESKPLPQPPIDIEMDIPALPIEGEGVLVLIDNVLQTYDQPAIIVNDRTLVPMRGIFEALGAQVYWKEETETVTAIKDDITISLQIGNTTAMKNNTNIPLDVPAQLVNDRTLVPIRFVSEALGCTVNWSEEKQTVSILTGNPGAENLFVPAKAFTELGSWKMDTASTAFTGSNLKGKEDESMESEPAKARVKIPETADYQIFVLARDYATNQQGSRYFDVELNGERIPKTFGQHGKEGFVWEKMGTFHLEQGILEIDLVDTSTFYARCGGFFITKDTKLKSPPTSYDKIAESAEIVGSSYNANVYYPTWAKSTNAPSSVHTLTSDTVTLDFYTVETPNGTVIQKQMRVNGEITTSRENSMGVLLMYAKEGTSESQSGQFPIYKATFTQNGTLTTVNESDIYKIGEPSWLIPSAIEVIDEKTAILTASNTYADATFKVELRDGEKEPLVTFTLTPKIEGQFTANILSGAETEEYSYAFLPFRFNGTVLPTESLLVTEPYATIPMALKTIQNTEGKNVTIGIAVEKESVPLRWPKVENAEYGFSLRGPSGGALPSLVTPLYTSENSKMRPGESYSIQYRIIESVGEWYPVYEHFALDIYDLTDYRRNYFSTLNDAIFNTTNLAASDRAGWDENQKGYYNIEAENLVTQSNPLVFMSTYLLTEDEDFLETRTIPTIAYLLTRPGFHYNNGDIEGSAIYGGVTPIGTPCQNYGTTVYGGGYIMSQGLLPQLGEYGIENGLVHTDPYGSSPLYQDYLWLYQYTGNTEYLEKAKTEADKYIEENIDAPRSVRFDEEMFIAVDFYPQFFGLIDLYEVTKEQKYIDAAVEAAKNLLPTVWIYPSSGDEMYTVSADYTRENHYASGGGPHWYGKDKLRPGYPDNMETLQDQTLPFWVVSRGGLSLEQTFTYTMHDSGNMIMANWAPDLLRLAEYSGEKIFETYARNAVVGRHATYSGYYYNNYFAYQQNPDYPYNGPDITGLYWHHIQPFLAMLQDFLFTQAWNWSNQNIYFPSVRNAGYAYFSNRMYGGQSGRFYDEKDMWLWLKEGLVETDNIQIDWIAARKDGVAAFAFMNEDLTDQTATFTLGDVLSGYTGEAVVYDADGNTSSIQITNGQATLSVPARSIVSIKLNADSVLAPSFAKAGINPAEEGKQTALPKEGETDTGYLLQMSPNAYYAYVYITESLGEAEKAVLHYKTEDGEWKTAEDTYAPFEFIIKVENPKADFTYYIEKTIDGSTIKSSQKTLTPLTK